MTRVILALFPWLLWALLGTPFALAQTSWGVGVLFNAADQPELFQKDIDTNILELARTKPSTHYRLGIHRDLKSRQVTYFPELESGKLSSWNPLFFSVPEIDVEVPGDMEILEEPKAILLKDPPRLRSFFKGSFENTEKRILVLYAHGFAFDGLKGISLLELKKNLLHNLPPRENQKPLDILRLDACFMGSLEVVYELRELADYIVASQESEFSAASPFESLAILEEGPQSVENVALELARRFVESYSYVKKGAQRRSVLSSSATLSVVETRTIENLLPPLEQVGAAIQALTPEQNEKLQTTLDKARMEKKGLVNLGTLLHRVRENPNLIGARETVTETLRSLELLGREKTKTNARLKVVPPSPNHWLVYGYEDWTRGHEKDTGLLKILPANMKPVRFISGWPSRDIHLRLYLTPFAVALKRFHYYFVDPRTQEPVGEMQEFERTEDFAEFRRQDPENPILYTAYTQSTGAHAERYTGLNIADPSGDFPSIEYLDSSFFQKTGWID